MVMMATMRKMTAAVAMPAGVSSPPFCYEPCQVVRQNEVQLDFGFRIPGLREWTSGFRWDLVNILKQRPYIVLVSHISEFRQAEIFSRWKFGMDLMSNIRAGWAEIDSRRKVRLDLESKEDGDGDRGQRHIFGIQVSDLRR